MLLRHMPDLSPTNTRYRAWFYSKWGLENCLILGSSRCAEYGPFRQRLSIKMATGGQERYFIGSRTLAVDDDSYLILNEGQVYGSAIQADCDVESFSIFFRPGLVAEVQRASTRNTAASLEDGHTVAHGTGEFLERLHRHDVTVTPVMRFIAHHVRLGVTDEPWFDEQLHFLAARLLAVERRMRISALQLDCVKAPTRVEIYRRIALATDFIESCYDHDIGLEQMARAACMSRFHFMRLFRAVHGMTAVQYLYRKRIQVARRLRERESLPIEELASRVGFACRATFYRQWKRWNSRSG